MGQFQPIFLNSSQSLLFCIIFENHLSFGACIRVTEINSAAYMHSIIVSSIVINKVIFT